MNNPVHMTNGLILDPFSIHATGIMRAHYGVKALSPHGGKSTKLFDGLHGEARFKQAFVNCCHFAETMTVVGPVAQLTWDKDSHSVVENALRWKARMLGTNGDIFDQFEEFCRKSAWTNIPDITWKGENNYRLNIMPDVSLRRDSVLNDFGWQHGIGHSVLNKFLYDDRYGAGTMVRDQVVAHLVEHDDSVVHKGYPVLGLMAITFTFKKPTGTMAATELVNLGSWPPVTFLIPTVLPSLATIEDRSAFSLRGKLLERQPAVSSYRISIGNYDANNCIVPYGQPYRLSSVSKEGKRPDILRSLSDVFKALWSQAAQYSAWNMTIPWDNAPDPIGGAAVGHIGDMSLDPLGAGRRIRGHNRHMSKYDVDNFSMLWEENLFKSETNRLVGWNLDGVDKRAWNRQMRTQNTGKYENIFVLPSYFTEQTGENLYPVALALARFGTVPDAGIQDFLHGGVLASVEPADHLVEDSVEGPRQQSFVDRMSEAVHGTDVDACNRGAIPVRRVEAEIDFDPEGDPTVFGLTMSYRAKVLMAKHKDAPLTDDQCDELMSEVDRLGNFQFLDAICAKSTKDLTDTFKAVKAKGISKPGTKAAALLDEELAIDLFGETSDGMFE